MKNFTLFICTFLICSLFGFQSAKIKKFQKQSGFEFIPSGDIKLNEETKSVAAFMMLNHEVTNAEYRLFIQEAYLTKGDIEGALTMKPDTNAWLDTSKFNGFMEPMANLYYSHPAYDNYPVVNVSHENAQAYCTWLGNKITKTHEEFSSIEMRLPAKTEWIYAAKGGLKSSVYPWGGAYTRNAKGGFLANFYHIGDHNISSDEQGKPVIVGNKEYKVAVNHALDSYFSIAPTKTFTPNAYGLYNMAGNAAELTADKGIAMGGHWLSFGHDIQVTSQESFVKANPFVGFRPVFTYVQSIKN